MFCLSMFNCIVYARLCVPIASNLTRGLGEGFFFFFLDHYATTIVHWPILNMNKGIILSALDQKTKNIGQKKVFFTKN